MSSQIVHTDLCITDRSRPAARTSAASPGIIFRFPPLVLRCSSGREGQLGQTLFARNVFGIGDAVARAIEEVYAAKTAQDRAIKLKQDATQFYRRLADARKAGRIATAALDRHRKEHNC